MVLEMTSTGRWRMQRHGTRMESVERRRVVLEERMKLQEEQGAGEGSRASRGWVRFPPTIPHTPPPNHTSSFKKKKEKK
ncbi:BQ5605_C026g10189 [Microbotryum silenes-dioicae]|uniref:BQ5605_C026g10189 protein n=1 Tax=Microbotryum silenes-dioicae TaxID=796604 RepID=A0A2X0N904_9BASI|nr:BQ5605_C026g10189 [Microbotryum silenes-dioicae]